MTRRKLRALSTLPPRNPPRAQANDASTHIIDKRSLLPQIASALTALTAVLAILISWLTFKMNRDGQIASRYSDAVVLLGSDKPQTRMGALYSLGDIAKRSGGDRPVITEILTGYVRQNIEMGNADPATCYQRKAPAQDIVTAMRVLFSARESSRDRIDLSEVCLLDVDLSGTDMTCVRLDNSTIAYSKLEDVKLVDASLQHASFASGRLARADFTGADAYRASFRDPSIPADTDLGGARLTNADFSSARLVGVDLTGADLTNTKLDGADLMDSDLDGARLATYLGGVQHLPPGSDRSGELHSPASLPSPGPSPACH